VTAAEREQIRAIVERTCAEQGVPLTVPAEVASQIAAMLSTALKKETP
jgi:hypothetical protein